MHRTPAILLAAVLCLQPCASARAQVAEGLRVNGYGTLGYVQDDRGDMVAIRDVSQRPHEDFGRASWQRDSRLGVQAEYKPDARVDLVGQAVLRDQVSGSLNRAVELAYLGLKPTPRLDLRIGRTGYDAYLMSDTRNIGYAYPWVRPFTEHYGWIPLFSVDGIDASYLIPLPDAQWRLKAQFGQSRTGIPIGDSELDFRAHGLVNLALSRQSGPWLFKAGVSRFTNRNEVSPGGLAQLQEGLDALAAATAGAAPAVSAEARELRRQLSFKDAQITSASIGGTYNDGRWLVQGEFTRTHSNHKIVPHGNMGYAVLGYRSGDWQPFVAYSASRPANALRGPAADWSAVGQAATQATALTVLNSTRMDQQTLSLGARWDFHNRAALKLQWDSTHVRAQGYGLLFKDPDRDGRSGRMQQLTLSLDFVF